MSVEARRGYVAFFQNRGTTDKEEAALLRSLTPPHSFYSFRRYCNDHEDIFGEAGSNRKKYRDRRSRIQGIQYKNYKAFKEYCDILDVDCPDTLEECAPSKEPISKDAASRFEVADDEFHSVDDTICTPSSTKSIRTMASNKGKVAPLAITYDAKSKFYFNVY